MDSTCESSEASELFQAQTDLYKHTTSFTNLMSIKCAMELGIPDIIHSYGKPITLQELASTLQLHPTKTSCLYRFLRLLVHHKIFAATKVEGNKEEEEEAYVMTPLSKLLVKGNEPCLAPLVWGSLMPHFLNMWNSSKDWLFGNKEMSLFESAYGMSFWDSMSQSPSRSFADEAMATDCQMLKVALTDCRHVFGSLDSLVDVGGGNGTMAKLICEAFPNLKCIVLDLPQVVANLPESQNLSYVGGDMFQSIPSADAVFLKWILHNWSDEHCIKILRNCKEAISSKGEEGKVIIIDMVLDENNDSHELTDLKLRSDIMMMAILPGKERNEKEWKKLFLEAGFRHYKIGPMFGLKSLIEVYP